jgi:hypothetical protein
VTGFRIQNMVATGDCGWPIRLEGLADEHSKFSSYEPELFPGLIYRMEAPRMVLLIFVSGKVVVTGELGVDGGEGGGGRGARVPRLTHSVCAALLPAHLRRCQGA